MELFSIGDTHFKLSFTVDDNNVLSCYDKTDYPLNYDQKWMLRNNSNPVEIQISGHPTSQHTGDRHIFTSESATLRYVAKSEIDLKDVETLIVEQRNSYISVHSHYVFYKKAHTIRCFNTVKNISGENLTLEYVSSFAKKDILGYGHYNSSELMVPHNSWYLECQWKKYSLMDLGVVSSNDFKNFKKYSVVNTGAWSTKSFLPMGILSDPISRKNILFQIEANGSWEYEIGDFVKNVTLNLSGPTLEENSWGKVLLPGESFTTVKVALTQEKKMIDLFSNITEYRRCIVHADFDKDLCPIIFNEYMFASWNCPSEKTAQELALTCKRLGAEYYVIDCGWHDEQENPFYYLGKWEESKSKYPHGLKKTMDYLRSLGLRPGLWMEPEVVGAKGNAHRMWDDDCYFQRGNKPLIVSDRYQLDFSNKKVTDWFYKKIDELVMAYGVEYFKFDYNIEPGVGFEKDGMYLGEALLKHNRAYHEFISTLRKKYPEIIFESCASGGNRLDYLTLSNVNLVSTSDQTDYSIYPYIVSNILTSVIPTQAAIWCYPKSEKIAPEDVDLECINMNILNTFVGRVHLASRLYLLDEYKQNFIRLGLSYYHKFDHLRNTGVPFFPKGLSSIGDSSLAFGLRDSKNAMLLIYNMKGIKPIKVFIGKHFSCKLGTFEEELNTDYVIEGGYIIFRPKRELVARLFEIEYE